MRIVAPDGFSCYTVDSRHVSVWCHDYNLVVSDNWDTVARTEMGTLFSVVPYPFELAVFCVETSQIGVPIAKHNIVAS